MSRTIKEIYNEAVAERNRRLELAEFASDYKLSVMNGILWVVAAAIYSFETLLDVFAVDISEAINGRINGTPAYYANALLQYQQGDELTVREDGLAFGYPNVDETKRIITQVSYVESTDDRNLDSKLILMDTLTADEYKRMIEATRKAAATPFYCTNGRAQSAQRITSIARAGRDVKLVVVDHFGLILRPGKRQDADESREIAHALKRLAQSLNKPVLCLAQLNRQNEQRTDKRPTLADLRATGAMEEDADGVIFVHRPDYYQADYKRERGAPERTEVILAKNRHGPTGRLDLSFWPETNTFNPAYVE